MVTKKKAKQIKIFIVMRTDHDEISGFDEVIRVFATEKLAQKFADKMNAPQDEEDEDFDPELEFWVKEEVIHTSLETAL